MKNEDLVKPWRDEKYNKIRERFIDKLYRHVHTTLENDMMDQLSQFCRKIDTLQRDLITMTKELDNLRQENVFLLNTIDELLGDAGDIGTATLNVEGK